MVFVLKEDKAKYKIKHIYFPIDLYKEIDELLPKYNITFKEFVIQACEFALNNMK